jgi:glycosyltransferase involved in cell wall biosynthesis
MTIPTVPISVVTTVYNRDRYLGKMIESVLSQTYKEFELLIWDDGSTDHSLAIAQSYADRDPRIRVVAAEHSGRVKALVAAVADSRGRYFGLVDSDDFLAATALEVTAAVLDAKPEVGLVYTEYLTMDDRGRVGQKGTRCQIPYSPERMLVDYMIFHFRLFRRSTYDQVGGFDPSFTSAEDYDLCLRISEVTQIEQVKQPLYYYRVHADSISLQQDIEQIRASQQAVNNALKRRGLADRYELHVRILSQFSLQEKLRPPHSKDSKFK